MPLPFSRIVQGPCVSTATRASRAVGGRRPDGQADRGGVGIVCEDDQGMGQDKKGVAAGLMPAGTVALRMSRLFMPAVVVPRAAEDTRPPRLFQLPRIRSCCLSSEELRRQWWVDVDPIITELAYHPPYGPLPLPPEEWLESARARLAEVVARPVAMLASAAGRA
jgi:hypothetical protein